MSDGAQKPRTSGRGAVTPSQKPQDGGAAFPLHPGIAPDWTASTGMTLRDWFAGQALAIVYMRFAPGADPECADLALQAYAIADAMLAEREAKP